MSPSRTFRESIEQQKCDLEKLEKEVEKVNGSGNGNGAAKAVRERVNGNGKA